MTLPVPRTTFTRGRAAEYFDAVELARSMGVPRKRFASALVKELLDNSLDACETAKIAPELGLRVTETDGTLTIRVSDNGPGLPEDVLRRIADFTTRTSDKIGYQSPTRGQMGNAWMTILGMPTALGGTCLVVVESLGRRHSIRAYADFAGDAVVDHVVEDWSTEAGTVVTVTIPAAGQALNETDLAVRFTFLNPHVTICWSNDLQGVEEPLVIPAITTFPDGWKKWEPNAATAPAWYTVETLRTLIHLHLADAQRKEEPAKPLRTFVMEFAGLKPTATAKRICAQFPGVKRLSDLDDDAIGALLAAMQCEARAPKPEALGVIGKDALQTRIAGLYGLPDPARCWYRKILGVDAAGLPFVVEVMVAETTTPGEPIYGVNFSPSFDDPLAAYRLGVHGVETQGIEGLLRETHVTVPDWATDAAPTTTVVHLTSPVVTTTDRGKTRIQPSRQAAQAILDALVSVTKARYTDGERRIRNRHRADRQAVANANATTMTKRERNAWVKATAFDQVWDAYLFVTDNEQDDASVRTLFYFVRPEVIKVTGVSINWKTFSQSWLPEYRRDAARHPLPKIFTEPQGTLYEPHGGRIIRLGSLQVDGFAPPPWEYHGILFCEKAGLWPTFLRAQIGERFDLGIVMSSGFSSKATRELLAMLRQDHQYTIYVLHDADVHGYNISRTLARETKRMPEHNIEVVDLGLTVQDALDRNLDVEPMDRSAALPKKLVPLLNPVELAAFTGVPTDRKSKSGKTISVASRWEINAMRPRDQVAFVESGLMGKGAKKLVPPATVLRQHATAATDAALENTTNRLIDDLIGRERLVRRVKKGKVGKRARRRTRQATGRERVRQHLREHRTDPWRTPVATWADEKVKREEDTITTWLRVRLRNRVNNDAK